LERTRWVLLVYRLPREPSRHRLAVWRKLRDLAIIAEAGRLQRKARMGGGGVLEQLGKLERRFRAERRRDYFRSPLRGEAAEALKAAREAARASQESAGALGGEGKR
jgi:hypothetical protein